ncbi:MAG: NHL repeat-containing protein [Thaumarchaeota archaeon]|nr:NHL repeat-containing protein [Nitrososphaerota archaeon]
MGTSSDGSGVCQSIPSCPLGTTLTSPSYLCIGPSVDSCTEWAAATYIPCIAIGQPNAESVTAGKPPSSTTIGNPTAVAFDSKGDLWVVDTINDRVLEFKPQFSTGEVASLVIGQTSLTGTDYGSEAGQLFGPTGITFDSKGDLWVVDSGDDRVLEFTPPFTNGENATLVLGQSSFEGYVGHTTAKGMEDPAYAAFDPSGDLWVTDLGNNRVLEYTAPFSTGQAASLVLGQANFTGSNPSSGANGLFEPEGIAFDSEGDLWVVDSANHRVLEYNAPFSTYEAASIAVGQPSLTSAESSSDLVNANSIAFDPSGNLWVSDGIDGVAEYTVPLSTGQAYSQLVGQKITSGNSTAPGYWLSEPQGVAFDKGNDLWVADYAHGRVVEYGTVASSTTASSSSVSATSSSSSSGVPVFPYQFVIATIFTVLLAASYLLVRRKKPNQTGWKG